jgi:hypothetical protein
MLIGLNTALQVRSPETFQLVRNLSTSTRVGREWEIGLGPLQSPLASANIGPSKRRAHSRSLGLKSSTAWFDYCRSGAKPTDIPYSPRLTYAKAGWAGYGDWLGTGRAAPGTFRSFKLARNYVHRLGLKSKTQWEEYCASGKKPGDIPAAPQAVYAEAGWAGYGDWLKTGTVATHLRQYKSFKEARAYVHGLGLKSYAQWRAYCKSGKKPDDIPAHADRTYADAGWAGMSDWLGTGSVVRRPTSIQPGDQAVAEGGAT